MDVKAAREALAQFRADVLDFDLLGTYGSNPFPSATVVRWTMDGRYTYVALLAGSRWYTTATQDPMVLTYGQLVETLARPDVSAVTVAAFQESRSIKP